MINEPKYDIENGKIVNAVTREPIPDDEPIMIFRGKDVKARYAISAYMNNVENLRHWEAVGERFKDFSKFAMDHPDRMKEPDTESPPTGEDQ